MKRLRRLILIFRQSAAVEWRYLRSHAWDGSMLTWIPLATVLLMWWIFSAAQITRLPIAVIDNDHSALSRQLIRYLDAAPGIEVRDQYPDGQGADRALDSVHVYAILEIPRDFAARMKSGRISPLVLRHNAQFATHSGQIRRDVQAVVATFSAGVEIRVRNRRGQSLRQARETFSPIRIATNSLFNPSTNYRQFLAAAMIPALLHILAMTAGAYAVGREIRDGCLDAWFSASGGQIQGCRPPFWEVVFALNGKLLWCMLSFTLWGALTLWLIAHTGTVSATAWISAFAALWLMMLVSFWLGVMVTVIPMSLRLGLSSTAFITAPSFAFAGITFPAISMSSGAKMWSEILPLTHYLRIQTMLLQMNVPFIRLLSALAGFSLVVLLLLLISGFLTQRAFRRTAGER